MFQISYLLNLASCLLCLAQIATPKQSLARLPLHAYAENCLPPGAGRAVGKGESNLQILPHPNILLTKQKALSFSIDALCSLRIPGKLQQR